nr:protein NLRC3-like [Misgurnus anguillicaudatus]
MQLCPAGVSYWKDRPALPSRACRHSSALTESAYQACGEAASAIHAMALLQERHLWLCLADMRDADKTRLLNAPVSQAGLFGEAVEDFAQQVSATQKQTEALANIMPRRHLSLPLAEGVLQRRPPPFLIGAVLESEEPAVSSLPRPLSPLSLVESENLSGPEMGDLEVEGVALREMVNAPLPPGGGPGHQRQSGVTDGLITLRPPPPLSPTDVLSAPRYLHQSLPRAAIHQRSQFSSSEEIRFRVQLCVYEECCVYGRITTEPDCKRRKIEQSENQLQDFNENMNPRFSHESNLAEVLNTFRSNLRRKFECLYEVTSNEGNPTPLNEIYTELYITESESGEISNEHEVRQIETQSRRTTTEETPIKCNDIFKPLPEQHKHIRSVLTKGVAGIGKTVSVQKFILDWAEEKENQDVHLIFPLPFREINLMKNKTLSLLDLLHLFFPETKEMEISSDEYKVLFIFDGLDECRLSLDFHSSVRLCDVNESTSVNVMLTNLIKGNLFPSSLIWITSRPAAADLIPSECVDRVTEVRGFTDPQKEEYFRKRISDWRLAYDIISHLKSSRSLYIMCHIPVFCWISVTVLERMLSEAKRREIPKTLTQMYTHFLIIQTNIKHQKDYEKKDEDMIFKLGKLAFEQLVKGNLIFYDEDLRECGIDVAEASVYSGLCTQIFREEFGLYQGKVYCFVHLSIQEHLAALYVHLTFVNNGKNVFDQNIEIKYKSFNEYLFISLHHRAVDESLQSKNGHLDLFLRFLLGLSLESNQILLQDLLTQMRTFSSTKEKTVTYIKQKMNKKLSTEKSINLIHCLNELGDDSLLEEIQHYVTSRSVVKTKLSSSQWAALVFVLLTSEQHLDELYLNKFIGDKNTADEVLVKLQLVIKETKKLQSSLCPSDTRNRGVELVKR